MRRRERMRGSETDASEGAAAAGAAPTGGASGGGYTGGESGEDEVWLWEHSASSSAGSSDAGDSGVAHAATVAREFGRGSAAPAIDAPSIFSACSDVAELLELPPEFWDAAPAAEAGGAPRRPLAAASQAQRETERDRERQRERPVAAVPAAKRTLADDATASKRVRPSPGTAYTSGPFLPPELAFRLLTNAEERCSGARPMFLNAKGEGASNGRIYKEQVNVTAEGKLQTQSKRSSSSDFWRKSARGTNHRLGRFHVDASGRAQLCSAGADGPTEGDVGDVLLRRQYLSHPISLDR